MKTLDAAKLRELVLYLTQRCESHPRFSSATLHKLLFHSDFAAFRELGQSITGARYFAEQSGPLPEPAAEQLIRQEMVASGELAVRHTACGKQYIALRPPDLKLFSGPEIAVADDVIEKFKTGATDAGASDPRPEVLAWLAGRAEHAATGRDVIIPYGTALVSNPSLDEFEEQHALELARRHQWPV